MKLPLLLITLIVSGNLFAQTVKVTNDRREKGIRETFYVLKSDSNIKDGPYAAYSRYRNKLLCEGFIKITPGIAFGPATTMTGKSR